ncbi:MAG: glycoside hydrolase family 43 protein [Bacteroidales bacterium]|nr:glycoside hydrolase family 43 protein [Bacteroidales bacterium]
MKNNSENPVNAFEALVSNAIAQPLVEHIYTADPAAHVFEGKIYIYPSHDVETGTPENDNGDHFDMRDYHILSMDSIDGEVKDHGNALDVKNIPWAGRQLWDSDAACKDGKYYLYFPLKDKQDIFRIGVAVSDSPSGPFKPEEKPMKGSYSIDPCVFQDDDGAFYMYFGGIWGGQLQRWRTAQYDANGTTPEAHEPAIAPRVAKLADDMLEFAETPKELLIVDKAGNPLLASDEDRRFFEASWMHKYKGKYYFSYSTGNTHYLCYATGDNPYGPFTYEGKILTPVIGWTTHHSIVGFKDKWYLFYHDCTVSEGKTHLRSLKVSELKYNEDGTIQLIRPYGELSPNW